MKIFLTSLLILTIWTDVFADSLSINRVTIKCLAGLDCDEFDDIFEDLEGTKIDSKNLKKNLSKYLINKAIKNFSYAVYQRNSGHELVLSIKPNLLVESVNFQIIGAPLSYSELKSLIPVREDGYIADDGIQLSKIAIKKHFEDRGFKVSTVESKITIDDEKKVVLFNVSISDVKILRDIQVNVESMSRRNTIKAKIKSYLNKPWNKSEFNIFIDTLGQEFFNEGFLYSELDYSIKEGVEGQVWINLDVNLGPKFSFYFSGNKHLDKVVFMLPLKETIKSGSSRINNTLIEEIGRAHV